MRSRVSAADIQDLTREVIEALLDARRNPNEAHDVIERAVLEGWRRTDVYLLVLPAVWHEIGKRWEDGAITVGDEHLATSVIQAAMRDLAPAFSRLPRNGRCIGIAAVDGERHDIGLRMVADVLDAAGWDVFFAGAATPTPGLIRQLAERQPQAVALGITRARSLGGLEAAVRAIRTELSYRPFVLIGGQGVPEDAEYAASIDADAWAASAEDAVAALAAAGSDA